jgi:response regulator RpfG family c-di-GMP phosphodiesterase
VNRNYGLFSVDEGTQAREKGRNPWKILIADDEEEVHTITRIVLEKFTFEGQGLEFFSAYSGTETKTLLQQHPDTAIVLLDVVMEEETTGLEVVRYIREELKNTFVRIILRTGQPGQAPERQVTMDYDINDYKEKTELTAQKLFTTIIGSLRAYRDLRTIEQNRKGLEQIVVASANLFEVQSLKKFAVGVLAQLTFLLHSGVNVLSDQSSGFIGSRQKGGTYYILAGTGQFENVINKPMQEAIPRETFQLLMQVREKKYNIFSHNTYAGYFRTSNESENLLYLQSQYSLNETDKELIKVFSTNVGVAFDNIYLYQAIIGTQREVISTLGEVIETRSKETGNHVKRVAVYSYLLALKTGLSEENAEFLRLASPMHDVGKIGIPDAILNKPGKLTAEEFNILKTHPSIGYNILKGSKQKILKTGAIIALQHHEHWDGSGYPQGLREEDIHIFARITKLVDVFDSLRHHRIYEEAWDLDRVLAFIKKERGTQFDPVLVDRLFENLEELLAVDNAYPEDALS